MVQCLLYDAIKHPSRAQVSFERIFNVYSCFDNGCPTKLEHAPQCLLIVIVCRYLHDLGSRCFSKKKREA